MSGSDEKPWGGRFNQPTNKLVEEFTASIMFDKRLYRYDIEGSIAHCKMLARQGIISTEEEKKIITGLKDILDDIDGDSTGLPAEHKGKTEGQILET